MPLLLWTAVPARVHGPHAHSQGSSCLRTQALGQGPQEPGASELWCGIRESVPGAAATLFHKVASF